MHLCKQSSRLKAVLEHKACVLLVVQTAQQTAHTLFHDMLPHLHTIYNDVILLNVLTEV